MKRIISVIGDSGVKPENEKYKLAYETGKALVDAGYRVQTGGMGGVMEAALAGAKASKRYQEGDTIAIIPHFDKNKANPHADIVVPTGLGVYRNVLTAAGDAVVAVGGASGTLSEIALAWTIGRMVVAYDVADGWGRRLAGTKLDGKRRNKDISDMVFSVTTPEELIEVLAEKLPHYLQEEEVPVDK